MSFGFASPWALLLLPLLFATLAYVSRRGGGALRFSRAGALGRIAPRGGAWIGAMPGWMRGMVLGLLILVLAGPRTGVSSVEVDSEGIAIMLVLDISSSMLAEDFSPDNRLFVAKATMKEFVRGRQHDRIGLVAFAGEALTQVPLTIDYPVLYQAIDQLEIGALEDGTAIGTAIATTANRLRQAPGESKVMVLLTDGENNRGEIDPLTAARAAAAFDLKVHVIGVGTHGEARIPVARNLLGEFQYAMMPVSIDEDLLREVASVTGGQYFRATSGAALDSIYQRIDELEKSTVRVNRYMEYTPRHLPLLLLAALILAAEWLLRASRWGRVP